MDKQQISKLKLLFDDISHVTDEDIEFWYARELQNVLGYTEWRNFNAVVEKSKIACKTTKGLIDDDFVDINKIVSAGATKKTNKRYNAHQICMLFNCAKQQPKKR